MGKSQAVRLLDVLALGPFLIYAGTRIREPLTAALLIAAGGATIGYNWANYEAVRRENARQLAAQNGDTEAQRLL